MSSHHSSPRLTPDTTERTTQLHNQRPQDSARSLSAQHNYTTSGRSSLPSPEFVLNPLEAFKKVQTHKKIIE